MSAREPSRDELEAMAYVDGELAPEARARFERRLAAEPGLQREIAELERLALIARASRPREPIDFEWQRLRRDPLQRAGTLFGTLLLALGAAGLVGWTVIELVASELPLVPKLFLLALLAGLALLLGSVLRARLKTRRFDPYTEIER